MGKLQVSTWWGKWVWVNMLSESVGRGWTDWRISAHSSVGTTQPRRDPYRTEKKKEENDAWGICPLLSPSTEAPGFREFYMDHLPWGQAKEETGIWFRAETLAGEKGSFHIVDLRESCNRLRPLTSQHCLYNSFPADQCHVYIALSRMLSAHSHYTPFLYLQIFLFIFVIIWGNQESYSHPFFPSQPWVVHTEKRCGPQLPSYTGHFWSHLRIVSQGPERWLRN